MAGRKRAVTYKGKGYGYLFPFQARLGNGKSYLDHGEGIPLKTRLLSAHGLIVGDAVPIPAQFIGSSLDSEGRSDPKDHPLHQAAVDRVG